MPNARRTVMLDHHRATIDRAVARLQGREDVLAVLVGGSIAHGFATPSSDVDLLIVVEEDEWQRRLAAGEVTELDYDSPTVEDLYVDMKYLSVGFIRDVATRGSETARFAFQGAIVAWSRIGGLDEAIRSAACYPIEHQTARIRAFHTQLEYWQWLFGEGERSDNAFVRSLAATQVVLFAGRLILAHNATVYPGYKWLLRVVRDVPEQPPGLVDAMERVIAQPEPASVGALFAMVTGFRDWEIGDLGWGPRFMLDTEFAWMDGTPAIAEL
jgi:predicted nucleotidyltransferase